MCLIGQFDNAIIKVIANDELYVSFGLDQELFLQISEEWVNPKL